MATLIDQLLNQSDGLNLVDAFPLVVGPQDYIWFSDTFDANRGGLKHSGQDLFNNGLITRPSKAGLLVESTTAQKPGWNHRILSRIGNAFYLTLYTHMADLGSLPRIERIELPNDWRKIPDNASWAPLDTPLGTSGNTGNAARTKIHLHHQLIKVAFKVQGGVAQYKIGRSTNVYTELAELQKNQKR